MRVSRRISIVAALVVVTVLAGLAALVGSSSSQASPQAAKATFLASLVSDIGKFNDRSFNQSQKEGLMRAQKKLQRQGQAAAVELDFGLHPEPDAGGPGAREPHHLGRLPARRLDEHGREEVPEDPLRDHRLLGQGRAVQWAQERHGPDLRGQRVRLPGRRARRQDGCEGRQEGHRRCRRSEDPAGRHLDRRVQVLRAEGGPRDEGQDRLLPGLRRGRQVQDDRREHDRPAGAGRSSRSPVAVASAP